MIGSKNSPRFMLQVPIQIWNAIALEEGPRLEMPERELFSLTQDELLVALDRWDRALTLECPDPRVRLAVAVILPILRAQRAIRSFLSRNEARYDLRSVLPELNNPLEAAQLMQQEYRLSPDQTLDLQALLKRRQTYQLLFPILADIRRTRLVTKPESKVEPSS